MKKKAYHATNVKGVRVEEVQRGHDGQRAAVGVDVSKRELVSLVRWGDGEFERPWKSRNPQEIGQLVEVLSSLSADRELVVALESSGTYGDALRQALSDRGIAVRQVKGKAAKDLSLIHISEPTRPY